MQQIKLHDYAIVLCQTKISKSVNAWGKHNSIQNYLKAHIFLSFFFFVTSVYTYMNREILIEIKYAFSKQLKIVCLHFIE